MGFSRAGQVTPSHIACTASFSLLDDQVNVKFRVLIILEMATDAASGIDDLEKLWYAQSGMVKRRPHKGIASCVRPIEASACKNQYSVLIESGT